MKICSKFVSILYAKRFSRAAFSQDGVQCKQVVGILNVGIKYNVIMVFGGLLEIFEVDL